MLGKGQHTEQGSELKTAEEYRGIADEHAETLKSFWKNFLVSGLFIMAAIVIILACLAWFLSNSQVNAGGVNVSAAGARFALTAAEPGGSVGHYEGNDEARKAGFDTSNSMTVTVSSNFNNIDAGSVYPGARGKIELRVTPYAKDLKDVTINVYRLLKLKGNDSIIDERDDSSNSNLLKLMSNHLLFFTSCDGNGFYSDRVTNSITVPKSDFCEEGSEETTKSVDVTLYWVWPEYLQNFVYVGNANYYKNLFSEVGGENSDYRMMQKNINDNKSSFYYVDSASSLPSLSSTMGSADLATCADAYNKADDYIGNNVEYLQLQLSANEKAEAN